jgi:glycosyltransferase involved in cell wall biosynthesis
MINESKHSEVGAMGATPTFSVIIPARNEQDCIGRCISSVRAAAEYCSGDVEIVVVANRCTDRTEEIAQQEGSTVVHDDSSNLSRIRNTGVRAASGSIVLTLDADSVLSPNFLQHAGKKLESGRYIGGGCVFKTDRYSPGMVATMLVALPLLLWWRISGICFWLYKEHFMAVGGFDEERLMFEDVEFARRLKRYGKKRGKRFGTLVRAHVTTSSRKFNRFGDWHFVLRPWVLYAALRGKDRATADKYWYGTRS